MALDGLSNFRDVGGLPLAWGGTTRNGVLFRSEALAALTSTGLDQLAATDIGVVVDLRTDEERQAEPDRIPVSRPVRLVELPLLQGAVADLSKQLVPGSGGPTPATRARALDSLPALGDLYTEMLQQGASRFAEVARLIAASTDDAPSAVLVHCTAGKDRTGVATALMLDAVGVERAAITADYAESQENLAGAWADGMLRMITASGVPVTPALRTLVTGTPPEAIEHALAWTDVNHAGSANYLLSGGLTLPELAALRARLVS